MSKTDKSIEQKDSWLPEAGEERRERKSSRYGVPLGGDKGILELDIADGCTTL